jgi:cbb3-type cytochrome oxidase subunit 3
MIQDLFKHLGGIEHYGIISLCLFVLVFAGVLVWAFTRKKEHLDYMARAPLATDAGNSQKGNAAHE